MLLSPQLFRRVLKQIRNDWQPLKPPPAGSTASPLAEEDLSEDEVGELEAPPFFVQNSLRAYYKADLELGDPHHCGRQSGRDRCVRIDTSDCVSRLCSTRRRAALQVWRKCKT